MRYRACFFTSLQQLINLINEFSYQNMNQKQENAGSPSNLIVNSVKYDIIEDPFVVPIKFKKQVPINKNIFELNEPLPKNYTQNVQKKMVESDQLHDPQLMQQAELKLLLIQKMNAYIASFSILLSIYELYWVNANEGLVMNSLDHIRWLSFGVTILLMMLITVGAYFHYCNNIARRKNVKLFIISQLIKLMIVMLSPNPWIYNDQNILHLTILLRLYFPFTFSIVSSMYEDPRAARITNLYGIKPELTFRFAVKVISNQKSVADVILIYLTVVIFYSHCLYIMAVDMPFIQCFEVVIATLPTIGYGEYDIVGKTRIIVLLIMITGVQLNAFVTFVVLKHFEMTTAETNSFILMEKLKIVQELESISSGFIIHKVKNRRARLNFLQQKVHDDSFKKKYAQIKNRYRNLNPSDSIYQFNYFKQMLNDLKIKILQTNNMVNVLLSRLSASQKMERLQFKSFQCQK